MLFGLNITESLRRFMNPERERSPWESTFLFLVSCCATHAFSTIVNTIFATVNNLIHTVSVTVTNIINLFFNIFHNQDRRDRRETTVSRRYTTGSDDLTYNTGTQHSMNTTPRNTRKFRTSTVRKNSRRDEFLNASPIRFNPTSFNSTVTDSTDYEWGLKRISERSSEIFEQTCEVLKEYKMGKYSFDKIPDDHFVKNRDLAKYNFLKAANCRVLIGSIKFTCLMYRQMLVLLKICPENEYPQVRELAYITCKKLYWKFDDPLPGGMEIEYGVNGVIVEMPNLNFYKFKIPVSRGFPKNIFEDAFVSVHLKMRREFNAVIFEILKEKDTDVLADLLIPFQGGPQYQPLEPGTAGQTFKECYQKYFSYFTAWVWNELSDEVTQVLRSGTSGFSLQKLMAKTSSVSVAQLLIKLREDPEAVPDRENWILPHQQA